MNARKVLWAVVGAAALFSAGSGGAVFATSSTTQTIRIAADANYGGIDDGGEFNVTLFTGMTLPACPVAPSGSLFQTFCLEVNEDITPGETYDWTVSDSAHGGGVGGAVGGADPICSQTAYLYSHFWNGDLANYDYTPGPLTRAVSANQLQRAIWFLENEITSLDAIVDAQALAFIAQANSAIAAGQWSGIGNARVLTITDSVTGPRQDVLVLISSPGNDNCPPSAIVSDFNGTSIPAGRSVWFNSVMKVSNQGAGPTTIHVTQQTAVSPKFNVALPDANITFTAAATKATTTYDVGTNTWNTTVPLNYTGNVFISGAMLPLPAGLSGGTKPVTWTATFSHPSGVKIDWQWAAAAYVGIFSSDLSTVGVKSVDSNTLDATYHNSDHAGTPESVKSLVIGGARGGGGSNFTGSYSGTGHVCID
jgi:hypothetical protein